MTVRRLQGLVEEAGKPADTVAEEFDLSPADVYAALQYYHTHPKEMAAAEERRHDREGRARQAGAKTVTELRQERDEALDDVSSSD